MAIKMAPPTPTTTPTTILLVLLKPPELLELELEPEDAEGSELDCVTSEVSVTTTVLPFWTEVKDVVTADPLSLVTWLREESVVEDSTIADDEASSVEEDVSCANEDEDVDVDEANENTLRDVSRSAEEEASTNDEVEVKKNCSSELSDSDDDEDELSRDELSDSEEAKVFEKPWAEDRFRSSRWTKMTRSDSGSSRDACVAVPLKSGTSEAATLLTLVTVSTW